MGVETMIGTALALSAAGTYASYRQGKSAARTAKHQYEREEARQEEQIAKSEAAAQRKYEADVASYQEAMRVYESNVGYLNELISDPTLHPDYAATRASLDKQFEGARRTLRDTLRRRGRTGGVQEAVLGDLQAEYESNLMDITAGISKQARQQKLALMKPTEPYLGQGEVNWAPYMQQTQAQPFQPDLSGFGMLIDEGMRRLPEEETDTESTLAAVGPSVTPYGGFSYNDIIDWARTQW